MLVRGMLPNPNRDLLPGFFVRMRLPMERTATQRVAGAGPGIAGRPGRPLSARSSTADNVVEKHYVQLGELFGGLRAITSGLAASDRVVVGELWRATPGTQVVPQLTPLAHPRRVRGHDFEILHRAAGSGQCAGDRAGADRGDLPVSPAGRAISEHRAADRTGDDPLSRRQRPDRDRYGRPADRAAGQRRPRHDLHGVDQRL